MRFYRDNFKKVIHKYLNTGTFNKEGEPTVEVEVQKHPDIKFKDETNL